MDKILAKLINLKALTLIMNKLLGHYVTIYMIHRAAPKDGSYSGISPELLEECLIYAKNNNFHFASVDEVVNDALNGITPKQPTLCFTIDDGFSDQVDEFVPILLKYNAKPTIYVLTDFVDNLDWPWDYKIAYMVNSTRCTANNMNYKDIQFPLDLSSTSGKTSTKRSLIKFAKYISSIELDDFIAAVSQTLSITLPTTAPDSYKPTSWEKLRHYESQGLMIGSHARTHRVFSSLQLDNVREELIYAKNRLAAELKNPSQVFCYPSGTAKDYTTAHAELVHKLGYLAAVSANPGNSTQANITHDLYNITRHSFPNTIGLFKRYSSWFEALRSKLA